uniref:Shisa N-terminal domain-containing protein n=1 Tax=Poecilia mexicana TaxID=48701 RepID=A0A3B3WEL8_9TELE
RPAVVLLSSLLLLAIQANARPAALRSKPKAPEEPPDTSEGVLEPLPKPLAQVTFPKNATSPEGLGDHFGAAHFPPRIMDGWTDVCWGYYDVMGHFDNPFNCSKDSYIYCCGTCHYRFCCPDQSRKLVQDLCTNYNSPDWAKPQTEAMMIPEEVGPDPDYDPLKQQSHNTGFVIGGVVVFMVAVAVGIKVCFNKVQQEANQRDLNMPRALVDMLRHQSSPVQQDERNNSVALTVADGQGTLGRAPKNLYAPGVKHNNTKSQPSFHHSLHNLAQLPPSYESATKPELNRYSSLKRLGERCRLLPPSSPADHLEDRMGVSGMGVVDPYAHTGTGIVPTLPRQQKAQSQQNVCATPSLDRHHMIKMNSHPTSGREQERSTGMTSHVSGGVGWSGEVPGAGVVMGTGTLGGHSARRMAFAAKRQNTIEQLHFIPGGGGGSQGIRTGSKNEVTV